MDARIDLTKTARFLSPFHKRPYDKNTDDTMGLRRILHECENDPTPELTIQLDAVEAFTATVLEPLTEAEQQARECEEIEDKFGHMSEPFVDDWSLPGYDYEGSDNTMRGSRMDAGYGEMGPL